MTKQSADDIHNQFLRELATLINKYGIDDGLNVPSHILANHVDRSLMILHATLTDFLPPRDGHPK